MHRPYWHLALASPVHPRQAQAPLCTLLPAPCSCPRRAWGTYGHDVATRSAISTSTPCPVTVAPPFSSPRPRTALVVGTGAPSTAARTLHSGDRLRSCCTMIAGCSDCHSFVLLTSLPPALCCDVPPRPSPLHLPSPSIPSPHPPHLTAPHCPRFDWRWLLHVSAFKWIVHMSSRTPLPPPPVLPRLAWLHQPVFRKGGYPSSRLVRHAYPFPFGGACVSPYKVLSHAHGACFYRCAGFTTLSYLVGGGWYRQVLAQTRNGVAKTACIASRVYRNCIITRLFV